MKYEEGNFDMVSLAKQAKEQRAQRNADRVQQTKTSGQQSVKVVQSSSDMESAKDGDYVQTEDGLGALVIDHEEQVRRIRERDKTGQALLNLINSPTIITEANAYVPDYGKDAPDDYDPGVQYINENQYEKKAQDMVKIKEGFSGLTYGPEGLVPMNSPEGIAMAEALRKLETGEVVLPSPEEYKAQKEELARQRAERRERLKNKGSNQQSNQSQERQNPAPTEPVKQAEPEPDLQMAEMPENAIMKKGVVEQMAEMTNNQNTTGGTVQVKPATPKVTPKVPEPVQKVEDTIDQPEVAAETPAGDVGGLVIDTPTEEEKPKVLNLAAAEAGLEDDDEETPRKANVPESGEPANKDGNITVINVEKGEADSVLKQLPLDAYDKVVKSKTIQVNEVETQNVPVATRRVTNIADYRALSQRRSGKPAAEVTERVLINSGIVITVKSATSMEMATIFRNTLIAEADWQKMYQFCYEHTVGTSIGKMGFDAFVSTVSPADVETIMEGIYEISETEERSVEINCGTGDGGCGNTYPVKIKPSTLPSVDKLPERSKNRIKEIIDARNDIAKAKEIQQSSPTVTAKYVTLGDRTVCVRMTTGHMMIERIDRVQAIEQKYNSLIALLILYVDKVTITLPAVREDVAPDVVDITDIDIICEELKTLDDSELEQIKVIISDKLVDYEVVTYSLKGEFVCPQCKMMKTEIPCSVTDLVFQKVQRMLE